MKKQTTFIFYLLLWIGSLFMMFYNLFEGYRAAYKEMAIAMAILCGLLVGEGRGDDEVTTVLDQLASIFFFLCFAFYFAFEDWPFWIIAAGISLTLCMLFAFWLIHYKRAKDEKAETDMGETGNGTA